VWVAIDVLLLLVYLVEVIPDFSIRYGWRGFKKPFTLAKVFAILFLTGIFSFSFSFFEYYIFFHR